MFEVQGSEASRRGLPAVSIRIDPGTSGAVVSAFPSKGTYVQLSGPPGGPLGARIDSYSGTKGDAAALEKLARARFGADVAELGAFELIELAGAPRPARTVVTGTSQARAVHLLALVPISANAERGVLVDAWVGAAKGAPAPKDVLAHARLGPVLATLDVTFD